MTSRQRRRQRRRGGVRSKLLFAAGGLLAVAVGAILGFGSWFLSVADEAPPLSKCKPATGGNSVLLAADGSRLGYVRSDIARAPVPIDRIGRNLQQATVAIEDQRFYQHNGVDYEGGLRALLENLSAGKVVQGGSTITMQLMRSLCFKHPQRTVQRKAQEAKLAVSYEQHHSKAQILDSYLNTASYGTVDGRTAVGVQAASRIYFSRPASRLSVEQAALLAGLPQAPSEYNPLLNPGAARQRRNEVLSKMADLGYISEAQGRLAQQRGLALRPSNAYSERREPYFFDYVEHKLIDRYGVSAVRDGGLRVQTTIEPRYQAVGRDAIDSTLPYATDPSGALVAIDPRNGFIRAMASSGSYADNQFNLAAQGHRQPGSTFKMFVLTTAIKQGIDPYHTYYTSKPLNLDLPQWGHWEVHTADEGYMGTVNIQQATVASDNTVFAQLDLDVGPQNVARTAHSMGVTTKLDGIPAEGLGGLRIGVSPLEMADAFATLASGGIHRNPIAISKVTFPGGRVEHPERGRPAPGAAHQRRLRGDEDPPRQHHRGHRHRRLHRLLRAGRQDRHHRQIRRRLVRWLPAQPGDLGLGRLPTVQRDRDEQRARDHRLRRHLPRRHLERLLQRHRGPLRVLPRPHRAGPLGPVHRQLHRLGAGSLAQAAGRDALVGRRLRGRRWRL